MDEEKLVEKLLLIEALFSGAATKGEQVAADRARQRILERLRSLEREDPPVEYRFSMSDVWQRKVFVALLRRYGFEPYRYKGQRYTTVMARIPTQFVDETLWPEFEEFSSTLRTYLSEVTDRIVSQVIHPDSSEAVVVEKPSQLPSANTSGNNPPAAGKPQPEGQSNEGAEAISRSGEGQSNRKGS